jgi:hypothetical protein
MSFRVQRPRVNGAGLNFQVIGRGKGVKQKIEENRRPLDLVLGI